MKKYEFTVFGTATTVKVFKFKEFPKPGMTTPVLNANFDKLYYGGKAWNIAYNLIKLGVPVYPVLAYSDDRFYDEIKRVNKEFGTPVDAVVKSPKGEYDYLACYMLEDEEKKHITVGGYYFSEGYVDLKKLTADHIPMKTEYLEHSRMAVLTCPKAGDLQPMYEAIKVSGLPMALCMSLDASVFNKDNLEPILMDATIIFANEAEIKWIEDLYGYTDITEMFQIGKAEIIVKTMGERGSIVYEKKGDQAAGTMVPITRAKTEDINAIGAGDAYVSGFLYGLSKGMDPVTAAQYGSTEASFIIEDYGSATCSPSEEELLQRNSERADAHECRGK